MTGNGPRHVWTDNDRAILALLYRLYENEKSTLLKIFNKINYHVLLAEGFPQGSMPVTTLMTQFYQMKKNSNLVFRRVSNMPLPALRRYYRGLRDRIEDGAQALHITLELRVEPHSIHPTQATSRQQQQHPGVPSTANDDAVGRDAWSVTTSSSDDEAPAAPPIAQRALSRRSIQAFTFNPEVATHGAEPVASLQDSVIADDFAQPAHTSTSHRPPSPRDVPTPSDPVFQGVYVPTKVNVPRTPSPSIDLANVRSSPRLVSTFDSDGSHSKRHPVLLFRAFDPELGFTARRFQGSEIISSPPVVDSDDFEAEVTPHLFVRHDHASPFISLTQFARYALKIISASQKPKSFAVFLYVDLEEEGRKKNKIKPRLVPKICDQFDLNDRLPNRYRGRGEFLVWGRIDSQPLLTLDTGAALELFGTLNSMVECSPEAAESLIPFLQDVDEEYREVVLRALVSSVKVPGYDWGYHSTRWEAFADVLFPGVQEARSHRAESVFSTVTVHRSPSKAGEAFLLVGNGNAEEENVDVRATEVYLQHVLRQPDNGADDDDEELSSEQDQAAIDAQLLAEARAYGVDEVIINTTTSEQHEATNPHGQPTEAGDSAEPAVQNTTTSTRHSLWPERFETGARGADVPQNNTNYENVVDLTGDSVMNDSHPAEINDVVMLEDDDDDIILVYPAPRRLPIRSPSVVETPTRASRYAEWHIHVLD